MSKKANTLGRRFLTAVALLLGLVFSVPDALAQTSDGAKIYFPIRVHDFGTAREEAGLLKCEFMYVNTGNKPLEIRRVTASCGCTTPTFSRQPLAPGDTSYIQVAYNTTGRPGNFSKSIMVYSNGSANSVTLTIRGTVRERENSVETNFPKVYGPLRLKRNTVAFGDISIGSVRTESIAIYNTLENQPLNLSLSELPKHLKATISNTSLPAGETGFVSITYLSETAHDFGKCEDEFYLNIEGEGVEHISGKITVTANLLEDFSQLTAESAVPELRFSSTTLDFGKVRSKKKAKAYLTIYNDGKAPLKIRKIVSQIDALYVKADKMEVAPGKSTRLRFELNGSKAESFVKYNIEVITNDPKMSRKRLTVQAEITD